MYGVNTVVYKVWWGIGSYPRGCFLGGMGGRSLVVSQGRKVGGFFFVFERIISLVVWDGVVGERGWAYLFYFLFFFDNMVT
jgi:hypothetical protein